MSAPRLCEGYAPSRSAARGRRRPHPLRGYPTSPSGPCPEPQKEREKQTKSPAVMPPLCQNAGHQSNSIVPALQAAAIAHHLLPAASITEACTPSITFDIYEGSANGQGTHRLPPAASITEACTPSTAFDIYEGSANGQGTHRLLPAASITEACTPSTAFDTGIKFGVWGESPSAGCRGGASPGGPAA